MKKKFKIYDGDATVKYEETEEKKQELWDAFIKWCKEHGATCGEILSQDDNCIIDAPDFMSDVLDNIVKFKVKHK